MIPSLIIAATDAASSAASAVEKDLGLLKNLSLEDLINKLAHSIVDFGFHLAIAIAIFYLGRFIIRRIYGLVGRIMVRRSVDRSLSTFILSLINMVLYFILIVTVIGILGINTSSFIALFASAGVAIGMALSGTLQNFAGGVLILLLKPYKVGDYIEAQGYAGTVTEIQIFHTIICTYDNKSIIIPNGGLSTGSINNWSREDYRRVDWTVAISYGDDVDVARRAILEMLRGDDRIVKQTIAEDREARQEEARQELLAGRQETQPDQEEIKKRGLIYRMFHRGHARLKDRIEAAQMAADVNPLESARINVDRQPQVVVSNMADSSIELTVRAWTRSSDYWPVYYDFNEQFYKRLPAAGINFPFPQLDVHLRKD